VGSLPEPADHAVRRGTESSTTGENSSARIQPTASPANRNVTAVGRSYAGRDPFLVSMWFGPVPQSAFFLLFLFATGVGSLFRAWQARGAVSDAVSKSPRQRMRSLSFFRGARP
jgi:hypothetical protein